MPARRCALYFYVINAESFHSLSWNLKGLSASWFRCRCSRPRRGLQMPVTARIRVPGALSSLMLATLTLPSAIVRGWGAALPV
jgi:hypothetical protein